MAQEKLRAMPTATAKLTAFTLIKNVSRHEKGVQIAFQAAIKHLVRHCHESTRANILVQRQAKITHCHGEHMSTFQDLFNL